MKTEEIRTAFLEFFKSKGHTIVPSSSLVPAGDPTLLFANSGMVQFKDCFLGTDKRAYTRATTCQKSLRISGKHNDLENVGRTARHHTFFEMLGNFSFGDYFKKEAIALAWEFVTEVLALPKDRLWATTYEEDEEALELWKTTTDIHPSRVLRFGKSDNFWAMGETGPCGPCSEIFYYQGDSPQTQSEEEFRSTDGLYIEIWNLVFMQYSRDVKGELSKLPRPSVDTGMGLERVAAVKQGVRSNFDSDLLRQLIATAENLSGKKYIGQDYSYKNVETDEQYAIDVAMRVIADHARAASFLVADGISPSSDGRGYVLRRLIRRACRHGRVLGLTQAFLYKVCRQVIIQMGGAYPELHTAANLIEKLIRGEEEKFLSTLDTGISVLNKEVETAKNSNAKVISGEVAFLLHDTYGFPLDMTEDIVKSSGLTVDTEGFSLEMEKQRERSRAARAVDTELILQRSVKPLPTKFVGYDFNQYESKVIGIFNSAGELQVATEGQEVAILTEQTPFYAESGGQLGDTGGISSANAAIDVVDTQKVAGDTIVHICRVTEGEVSVGAQVRLAIDEARRQKLRVNHSATHLLHLALREVLGTHVKQAGSRVSEHSTRFDFSHLEPVSSAQLTEIENLVNQQIQANHPVVTEVLALEDARKTGAMALFGEKYGEKVRVVRIGPRSLELCGGTHTSRSGDIGLMTIVSESGISSGVRRIEALAGNSALQNVLRQKTLLSKLCQLLSTGEQELFERVNKLCDKNRSMEQEVERLGQTIRSGQGSDLSKDVETLPNGVKFIAAKFESTTAKQLREIADDLKQRIGSVIIALASITDNKAIFLTATTEDLAEKYHAGELMKQIVKIAGSRGGGRPDLAQSGGGEPAKIDEALNSLRGIII